MKAIIKNINCKQANEIPLENLLAFLGHLPTTIKGSEIWYLSPFRTENTASFKVDTKTNRFYDFGTGEHGGIIDFVRIFHNCDTKTALHIINDQNHFSFQKQRLDMNLLNTARTVYINPKEYCVNKVKKLENIALIQYLESRCIPVDIAKKYLKEVYYSFGDKKYFSICIENNMGGLELRNRYFKGCLIKKEITTIESAFFPKNCVHIFEGFMDFLSWKAHTSNELDSVIILNSTALIADTVFVKSLEEYNTICTYFDNDPAGDKATKELKVYYPNLFDYRYLYMGFSDYNEWWISENQIINTKNT